jgi:hypothetical protein
VIFFIQYLFEEREWTLAVAFLIGKWEYDYIHVWFSYQAISPQFVLRKTCPEEKCVCM